MSNVNEIITEYDRTVFPNDEEREIWLLEKCREYDHDAREDVKGRAALYNELGSFYRNHKMLEKAESAFKMAIDLMETPVKVGTSQPVCKSCSFVIDSVSIEGNTDVYTGDFGTILNNLAGCYRLQGRLDEALETFEEADRIYASLPDLPGSLAASCKNNKGLVYLDKGQPEEAEKYFQEAFLLLEKAKMEGYELAMTYGNMAVAHYRLNNFAKALEEAEKGLEILEQVTGKEAPVYQGLKNLRQIIETRI